MAAVQAAEPSALPAYRGQFNDPRLPEMLFRYQARNYPGSLGEADLARWHGFIRQRRDGNIAQGRRERLQQALSAQPDDPILLDLQSFYAESDD